VDATMQNTTAIEETSADKEQHYMKQILDNFPDGVFTIDTYLAIQYVNPAFCRIVGFTEDELLGSSIMDYLGDLNILDTCMAEVERCGHCNDQETIFKRKDGSMVNISKNVQAVSDEAGNFKEILVSIRDLTDVHHLNKELERNVQDLRDMQQQLVEAEKMASLGGLVAGIAHEINTPLGISVTSATSMHEELDNLKKEFEQGSLKRSQLDGFFGQAGQACNILHNNLKRASELVNSFKQVAVDQTVDEVRSINLDSYCHEVLTSLGPKLKHSPVKVITECDSLIELETHPGAIYQVISNLIINSLIHAYDDGQEGSIRISGALDGDEIVIDFQDDGKGIEPDALKRIFEPFYTTRRGQGGSGLGLSIVYNIVTATLRGAIKVESTPGQGTHFRIVIPRA
jgi:PAS domain S-box-containing protein